jgi:dolichyl-diphosphooligosaccharide--protein glycosyltransferase
VRIYRVKKPDEFNRPRIEIKDREIKSKKTIAKKTNKKRRGVIKSRPVVVKGIRR